jgi:nickel-dependent lactate racemase
MIVMKVDLHYGKGFLSLQIPEANVNEIIQPCRDQGKANNITLLREALAVKEVRCFQDKIAGMRLCVLVDDGTRDEPFDDIFSQVSDILQKCTQVRFLICTGTHNPETSENDRIREQIAKAAEQAGIGHFEIHTHDCEHETFIRAGQTSRGTEVLFNALVDEADVFVVLSDVKVHYFAGYSNPVKNFLPGICTYETAEQNHSLVLDERSTFGTHPWHKDKNKRNNPVAEDQLEGMRLIVKNRPVYALVTISESEQLHWARFGLIDKVSSEAFDITDECNTHIVLPADRLIVSPGGLPNDINLYIAQRALELTKCAVKDGGEILFLAECHEGIGETKTLGGFYNRLMAPIDEILRSTENEYVLYSHKPYKFAQMMQRLRQIWIYSEIPDKLIKAVHLHAAHEPQAVVDGWLAEQPDTKINIVDGANKVALYRGDGATKAKNTFI